MQLLVGFVCFTLTIAGTLANGNDLKLYPRGLCGTSEPGPALKRAHQRLSSMETQARIGVAGSLESLAPIEVDTWFHIVSTKDQADLVTNEMVTAQVSLSFPISLYISLSNRGREVLLLAKSICQYDYLVQASWCRPQHK